MKEKIGRVTVLGALLALALLGLTSTSAFAGTAEEINVLPTLDPLNRTESSLSNGGKWSVLNWATNTSQDTTSGWIPASFSTVSGAYWNPSTLKDSTGDAVSLTMPTAPGVSERYLSVWLNMPSPGTAKSGYQLRWTVNTTTSTYAVKISKWVSGTETVLASNASVTIPAGATLALADTGANVSAYMASGGGAFSSLLSASDSTYASGYAGIEGSGSNSRSTNFKVGALLGGAITGVPVLDSFERQEVPLATGKFTKTAWTTSIGGAYYPSYHGYGTGSYSGVYWNPSTFNDSKGGLLIAATMGTGSPATTESQSLWLNMPAPGTEQSGYELRLTGTGTANTYKAELSKWVAGTRTVLGTKESVSVPPGTTFALSESGGSLVIWTGTSSFTPLLSATDTTYTSGYAGPEVKGGAGTLYNLRAGSIAQPPDTTISAGPTGTVLPDVSFSFTATEAGASFECSLDAGAYAACTSPKAYSALAEGSHSFRVRAVGVAGTDETPAERSFTVAGVGASVTKVPLRDDFNRQEIPLANGKWTKTSWGTEIGGSYLGGYHGYGGNGNAAVYWNQATFSAAEAPLFVAATVGTGSPGSGESLALTMDMPSPGGTRAGYEARFSGVNGSATNYKAELAKWVSGTRTVLATKEAFSLPVNTIMTLVDTGPGVSLWTGTGTNLSSVLSASDATYNSGSAGVEVMGGAGTLYNFRAGQPDFQAPDTTIQTGPTGTVAPEAVSFTFTSTESGSTFECSLDAGAYSACTSPKAYPTIGSGAHTFKVRAVDAAANQDATPAERSFSVIKAPSVSNQAASAVKSTQATLGAEVNPNNSSTTYQFEYGTTTSYGTKVPVTAKNIGSGTTNVSASEPVTGLTAGTLYHFRISATNAAGNTKGSDQTFTTTAAPAVTTEAATSVEAAKATLKASVNPKGATTTYQFEYGPTTSYGTKVPATAKSAGSGLSSVAVSEPIAGLTEGATYHFRVVASNEVGTVNGADKTLTTPFLPGATTKTAEAVEAKEAVLTGSVEPNGSDTTYRFEYGTTTAYGTTVPSAEEEVDGVNDEISASESVASLNPETTYHYRIVATSNAGTVAGADKTLTTAPPSSKEEGILPNDFLGMMWSGNPVQTVSEPEMDVFGRSGARWLRVGFHPDWFDESRLELLIQRAADRGIRILPNGGGGYLDAGGREFWTKYIKEKVERYGPNGTYWASNTGADMPITAWEIGNEPNLGKNTPFGGKTETSPPKPYDHEKVWEYGEIFEEMSKAADAGAANRGGTIQVILSALFTTGPTGCDELECHMEAAQFIKEMGHHSSYDAVSIHPYAFKVGKNPHAPANDEDVKDLVAKIRANLAKVHDVLTGDNQGKQIWITELGFPVSSNNPQTFPPVTEPIQAKLITASFDKIQAEHETLGVNHLFLWNIRDEVGPEWEWHSGLRRLDGTFRKEAWKAYLGETGGNLNWPRHPKAQTLGYFPKPRKATLFAKVDPEGLPTEYRFQWGQNTSYTGTPTAWASAGWKEGEVEKSNVVEGLQPNTEYHYRVLAKDENGEQEVGLDKTLKTPPSSSTSTNVKRVLHGQPGWVWIDGWVKEGEIEGPNAGPGLGNVHVHVKLFRNGSFVRFADVMTNGEGHYDSGYLEVGKGDWEVASEFPGGGEWDASETSPRKTFTVRDGVEIIAKHSGKCMDVEGAWTADAVRVMHGECHGGANQVFTMRPKGDGSSFELVPRHSGKCVDVAWADGADGAAIIQHGCNGGNNQAFRENFVVGTEYRKFEAVHSSKCLDVTGGSTEWAPFQQWTCNGNLQQQFRLQPLESGPIGTETFFTTDHIIHGNGQYGNWGLIGFHGNLQAGAYNMENRVVQIEFQKWVGDHYVTTDNLPLSVNWEGAYHFGDYGLAPGIWRVQAHFMGNSEFGESTSAWHDFSIFQANRLVARHSNKCLTLSENKNVNGQQLIQWDCVGTGSMQDGQSFWFWPMGNNIYQITVISSGKCLDIRNGDTGNGGILQQWDCNGYGQQKWELLPIAGQDGWYALRPQHASNKCLDVYGAQTGNGATVWQWDCHWGPNQQWKIVGVVGG
jgi:Ricin-type beta-trefoil lectin domain-like